MCKLKLKPRVIECGNCPDVFHSVWQIRVVILKRINVCVKRVVGTSLYLERCSPTGSCAEL